MSSPVFLGCITHDARIDMNTAKVLFTEASKQHDVLVKIHQSSLLAKNCNELWCDALNMRAQYNLKWFVLLHSDVRPEPFFIDKLIELAESHEVDLLSVALPIKDERGLTSTAISHKYDAFKTAGRITQKQLKQLPEVFSAQDVALTFPDQFKDAGDYLLANTGCMLVRLDMPFSEFVAFTINDKIENIGGRFVTSVEPEDWFFTRYAAQLGARVRVTSAIKAFHVGTMAYNNQAVWGLEVDINQ